MTRKGYGFAVNANESSIDAGPAIGKSSTANAVVGGFPFDEDLSEDQRAAIVKENPLAFYVRPNRKRKPKALIIGPAEWSIEDLLSLRDQLAKNNISAETFRADDLSVDQVLDSITTSDCVVLVTGAGASWGRHHRIKITATADRLEKRWRVLEESTWSGAADAAARLL